MLVAIQLQRSYILLNNWTIIYCFYSNNIVLIGSYVNAALHWCLFKYTFTVCIKLFKTSIVPWHQLISSVLMCLPLSEIISSRQSLLAINRFKLLTNETSLVTIFRTTPFVAAHVYNTSSDLKIKSCSQHFNISFTYNRPHKSTDIKQKAHESFNISCVSREESG